MAASEKLNWIFELFDRMSGPLDRIRSRLGMVEKLTGRMRGPMGRFVQSNDDAAMSLSKLGVAMKALGVYYAGKMVLGVAKAGVELAAWRESSMASLELMLGSKEAAKGFMNQAMGFARVTPFSPKEVVDSFKDLLASGFTKEEVPIMFQAVGDVAALSGSGAEGISRLNIAFSQIMGKGKLLTQELNQITETAGRAGIGRAQIFESLAKTMGVKDVKLIPQMMEDGLIDSKTAIFSIVKAIETRMGGLGVGMMKQSETLGGLWSTLAGQMSESFLSIPEEELTGLRVLKDLVKEITNLFAPGTDAGRRFQSVVVYLFNAMASGLRAIWDTAVFFWEAVQPAFERFAAEFADAGQGLPSFRDTLLTVAAAAAAIVVTVLDVVVAINQLVTFLDNLTMEDVGKAIMDGLLWGLESMVDGIYGFFDDLMFGIVNRTKGILGIRSPSAVFEELGLQTGAGYEVGLRGSFEDIDSPVGAFIRGETAQAREGAAGGKGGKAPVAVTLTLNVDARGNSDGEGLARMLADLLPGHITAAVEQVAMEGGTA